MSDTTHSDHLHTQASHQINFREIEASIDEWYAFIKLGVETPHLAHDAIKSFAIIFPCVLTDLKIDRWSNLLLSALNVAQNLHDNELQMQIWKQLGQIRILNGKAHAAQVAFHKSLERAEEQKASQDVLEAYAGLLQVQMIHPDASLTDELIQRVDELIEQTSTPVLHAMLAQALAFAYVQRGAYEKALEQGKVAFDYWQSCGNTLEMARTVYTIASAHRALNQYDDAQTHLERAKQLFGKTSFPRQYVLITHEQASIYYKCGQYQQALQWFKEALKESYQTDHNQLIAAVRHGLALAQIAVEEYSEAGRNLRLALDWWIKDSNYYQQACICQAMGHLDFIQQNPEGARSWWQRGLRLCKGLSDMDACRDVIDEIQDNLSQLSDTDGLSCEE